jgi:hypothetical protein
MANHNPCCLVYRSGERRTRSSDMMKPTKLRSHNRLAFLFIGAWLIQSLVFGEALQTTFEFHSGFWVNLHHFLYEQAKAESSPRSSSPEWLAALDYYRREVIKRDLLSDQAAKINNQLSNLEDAPSLRDSGLPADLIAALNVAAPIYKARWWPEHDRANHAWIEVVEPLISKHSGSLKKELAAAYLTDWPATPIRTDVVEYANWSGAYTTLRPTHITVSSVNPGNQGDAALEILFHEASHAMFTQIGNALSAEVKAQNRLFRRSDLWHAVLFYTAGEMVRRHLDGYIPYAVKNGLYDRAWQGVPEILELDWKPYLDGKVDLATAVRSLVDAYGISR